MVISQPLINQIEWNKFHFLILQIELPLRWIQTWPRIRLQFFPGDENPIVCFFWHNLYICLFATLTKERGSWIVTLWYTFQIVFCLYCSSVRIFHWLKWCHYPTYRTFQKILLQPQYSISEAYLILPIGLWNKEYLVDHHFTNYNHDVHTYSGLWTNTWSKLQQFALRHHHTTKHYGLWSATRVPSNHDLLYSVPTVPVWWSPCTTMPGVLWVCDRELWNNCGWL